MAKKDVYANPIGAGLRAPNAFVNTSAYYQTAAADVRARIALAGVRLANLLTRDLNN